MYILFTKDNVECNGKFIIIIFFLNFIVQIGCYN